MRLDLKMEFCVSFEDAQEAKNEMKDIFIPTNIVISYLENIFST